MIAIINPGRFSGSVKAPASKSMMQRCLAAALLHQGTTTIHNPGYSADDLVALQITQQLGAEVLHRGADLLKIQSNGVSPVEKEINCGESGLSARLFTPIAALSSQSIFISGRGSLLTRPMEEFGNTMTQLNVSLAQFNGRLPFYLQGPIQPANILVDGSVSSQYLSGLLLALSSVAEHPVTIEVSGLKSKPYIDMTLQVLAYFGRHVTNNNYKTFTIDPANFELKAHVDIRIEGDWSNAAFWLTAGAINGDVLISGLDINSRQADRALLRVFEAIGAKAIHTVHGLGVTNKRMFPFEFDATHCPDLFPVLAILAAFCQGESFIKGLHRLFYKESNRVESIAEMLEQFEIPFSMEDDMLSVMGVQQLAGATIDGYNDHRIVMAAAIAATRAEAPVVIEGAEAVNKSYPDFFTDLVSLGIDCTLCS